MGEGETIGRDHVCASCAAHVETCSGCSTRTLSVYSTRSGARVCSNCARRMQRCGYCSLYEDRNVDFTSVQDRQPVCDTCLNDVFTQCDDCEEWHGIYDSCTECNPDDDEDYDNGGSYGGHVHYYSYKPDAEFHGEGTKAYLGLELEVARTNYKCAELVADALGGLGYMKEDSSINGGFEIVTHPMTHAYAAESFPWDMLEQLASEGARADSSCGIHVHVSREGFDSASHCYRWMKLFYRNEQGICGVARRSGSSWARFSETERKNVKNYAKGDRYDGQRYSVINVQNDATFEIRAFRSSLVKQEVQAALDLVAASVEYTRNLTVPTIVAGGWTWEAFRAWVAERPEYTALSEEMAKCAS
jgi:Putative amidoligase enzyme